MSELLDFIISHEEAFKSQARLTSLYSDFALLKQSNLDGYAANVTAWRSALEKACRAGLTPAPTHFTHGAQSSTQATSNSLSSSLAFRTDDELVKQLETRTLGRPLALGEVVNESVSSGSLIPLPLFLNSKTTITTPRKGSWIPSITLPTPYDVAKWLLSQVGFTRSSSAGLATGDFVVLKNVEEASAAIVNHVNLNSPTSTSLIYSLETFTATFRTILPSAAQLTSLDIALILTYLSRDKHAITLSHSFTSATTTNEPLVIKFHPPNTTHPQLITQQDSTIASLRTLSHTLSLQQTALETRINTLISTMKPLLSQSSTHPAAKTRALTLLRQRKSLQSTLQRRLDAQTQVEDTLTAIDDAVSNVEITSAMDASATVLRDLNKKVGGVEGVTRTMDALADAKAEGEEWSRALHQDGEGMVDEGDVEEELEAMMKEGAGGAMEEEVKEVERPALPDVPVSDPSAGVEQDAEKSAEKSMEEEMEKRLSNLSLEGIPKSSKNTNQGVGASEADGS